MRCMTSQLLLIDDHALFRSGIAMVLGAGLKSVKIHEAATLEQALRCPCESIDLLLLDVKLEGVNGLDGIAPLKRKWPMAKVVMVSALQSAQVIEEAMSHGAEGFICKTEPPSRMLLLITDLLAGKPLQQSPQKSLETTTQHTAKLTPRQCEVLDLLCQGLSNKLIGRRLGLSENTVRGHVQATLAILQVSSRSEAVFVARRQGIID